MIDKRTRDEFVYLHKEELSSICINKDNTNEDLINEIISKARIELNYSKNYDSSRILATLLNTYRNFRKDLLIMDANNILKKIAKEKNPVILIEQAEGASIELASALHRLRMQKDQPGIVFLSDKIADAFIELHLLKNLVGDIIINDLIERKLKNLQS